MTDSSSAVATAKMYHTYLPLATGGSMVSAVRPILSFKLNSSISASV